MYRKLGPWLIALAMVAVACGDTGDDGTDDTSPPVTSEQAQAETTTSAEPTATTSAEPATTTEEAPEPEPTTTSPPETAPATTEAPTTTAAEEGATTTMPDRSLEESGKEPEAVPQDEVNPPAVLGEVPAGLMDAVLADAVSRTGSSDIEVLRAQAIEWNDGSLGCPEPGQSYTQAIVPGYWVELSAGGTTLDYPLNDRGFFKVCTGPGVGDGGSPSS